MTTCDSPACGAVTEDYEVVIVTMLDGHKQPEAWCRGCCDMWGMHDDDAPRRENG